MSRRTSFICWGIPGLAALGLFAWSHFAEDGALWAGAGLLGVLLCVLGHELTRGSQSRK